MNSPPRAAERRVETTRLKSGRRLLPLSLLRQWLFHSHAMKKAVMLRGIFAVVWALLAGPGPAKAQVDTIIDQPKFTIVAVRKHAEIFGRFDFDVDGHNATVVNAKNATRFQTTASSVGMTFPLVFARGPTVVSDSKAELVLGAWPGRPQDRALRLGKKTSVPPTTTSTWYVCYLLPLAFAQLLPACTPASRTLVTPDEQCLAALRRRQARIEWSVPEGPVRL